MLGVVKVFLAEDDPTIRSGIIRALTDRGHIVTSAPTAMAFLRLVMAEHPDVVLLDLGLPDLDGREVLRMLRAISQVPIIVVTPAVTRPRSSGRWTPGPTTTW